MARTPEKYQPFDPAKAARDRAAAAAERPAVSLTLAQHKAKRPLLRPEKPRSED